MDRRNNQEQPVVGQPIELGGVDRPQSMAAEPLRPQPSQAQPARQPQSAASTAEAAEEAEAERVAEAIKQAFEDQAREDEKPHSTSFTLRQILGGEMLQMGFMRKNVRLMLIVAAFLVVSVSNRYSTQKMLIEINKLETKLADVKYRALSTESKYTEKTRQSYVLQALRHSKDSVLEIPDQPPFKIQVPENDAKQ